MYKFFAVGLLWMLLCGEIPAYEYDYHVPICDALNNPDHYQSGRAKVLMRLYQTIENWLFSEYELKPDLTMAPQALFALDTISKELNRRGTQLVIAPILHRGLVYPKRIPMSAEFDFEQSKTDYYAYLKALTDIGLNVVDFSSMIDSSEPYLFYKRDFHWTYLGAAKSAEIIAEHIKKMSIYKDLERSEFKAVYNGVAGLNAGVLKIFTEICGTEFPSEYKKIFQTIEQVKDESNALFGDNDDDDQVILLGTSFSALVKFNFFGFLREFLSVDVSNYAVSGGNVFGAFYTYFNTKRIDDSLPKIIVWEFPIQSTRFNREDIYSLLLPSVLNLRCDADNVLMQFVHTLKQDENTIIFNGGENFQYIKQKDIFFELVFENKDIYQLDVDIHYVERRKYKSSLVKSLRLENDGRFLFDLGHIKRIQDLHFISLDAMLKEGVGVGSRVTAKVCARS